MAPTGIQPMILGINKIDLLLMNSSLSRAKLLITVSAKGSSPSCVQSLTLQPGSEQGYVIATASYGGILRLFDIRRSGHCNLLTIYY